MKRRIFIGCLLSEELQKNILEWRKDNDDFPVRWIPAGNLHITLVPPWYEDDTEGVINRISSAKPGIKPFAVTFETISLGPDSSKPRLVWASGKTPNEMLELKEEIEKLLQITPEKRRLITHITLARLNKEQAAGFPKNTLPVNINWKETINTFSLIESRLKPTGSEYIVLKTFDLHDQ